MSKDKREPRKNLIKNANLLVPFNIEKIGNADDPCFGKLYEPSTEECSRCGDNEICAIATMQRNALKRAKIEANGNFKDMEEADLKSVVTKKELRLQVKARIREIVKLSGKNGVSIDEVVNDVNASYFREGYTKERLEKLINIMVDKSSHISKTKNNLTWK